MRFGVDFDALAARFFPNPQHPIALAVSGGSDSLALLLLAHDWASRSGYEMHVFTVDHGLREAAKTEAETVATHCRRLGHAHTTLIWKTPKPTQSAARRARYRLLCEHAHKIGARCLLVGHTLDDVVETAIIRRRRGVRDASVAGPVLASPAPIWPEGQSITLLRPLVSETRTALRETLVRGGWSWIDDPSNESAAFERVRVRQFLARHSKLSKQCGPFVRALQSERNHQDIAIGQALKTVRVRSDGLIQAEKAPNTPRLLALLARCASGSDGEPRASALAQLVSDLDTAGMRQTLGGAWFQRTKHGFQIGRDPGESKPECACGLFDGRFEPNATANLPLPEDQAFIVRGSSPPGGNWREIISDRIAHMALCYSTPALKPVEH